MANTRNITRGFGMGGVELPEWLNALVAGIVGIGSGGYVVARKLKADRNSDALDAKAQVIIERLETQLGTERLNNSHLGEVIDRVAKERNDAVQQVGRLQGTVEALSGEVERMRGEVIKLEKKNVALTEEITSLNGTVRNLSDQIHVMLSRFEQAGAAITEARKND